MANEDLKSEYLVRGGSTEVVHLDEERRVRVDPKRMRSTMRPRQVGASGYVDSQQTPPSNAPTDEVFLSPPGRQPQQAHRSLRSDDAANAATEADVLDGAALRMLAHQLVDEICSRPVGPVEPVLGRLLLHYEFAEAIILERFPGPLWVEPSRLSSGDVRGAGVSALASCLVALSVQAARATLALLHSSRPEQRIAAAFVAGEVPSPELLLRLFELVLHDDPRTRLAAVTVLPRLSHVYGYDHHLNRLRVLMSNPEPRIRYRAVQAVEELRDPASVPTLIDALRDPEAEIRDAARSALRVIAGRDYGRMRWLLWLRANQHTSRFAWLVDAIEHGNAANRHAASKELAKLTGRISVLPRDASRGEISRYLDEFRTRQ